MKQRLLELPVLERHVAAYPCAQVRVVLVAHLLPPLVPFLRAVARHVDVRRVLGVPYSNLPDVHAALEAEFDVRCPRSLEALRREAVAAVERELAEDGPPVVLVEVGGYCAGDLSRFADSPRFLGAVEHTKQGHWRYAAREPLPRPVLSIADSRLKRLENQQVGRSLAYTVDDYLRRRCHAKAGDVRVGVLGYGEIGAAAARFLRKLDAEVWVHDSSAIKQAEAILDGFPAPPRAHVIERCHVLLGASGARSLTLEDLYAARDGAIIASGSSKQVEIDVAGLHEHGELLADDGETRSLRLGERVVHLVRDGQPINFHGGNALGPVVDLIYTELYRCMQELASGRPAAGLQELPARDQEEVAAHWCATYGGRRTGASEDVALETGALA